MGKPNQPRDPQGVPTGGQWTAAGAVGVGAPHGAYSEENIDKTRGEIARDYYTPLMSPKKAGMTENQREGACAVGVRRGGLSVADAAMVERMEEAGGREAMLEAYGSQESWYGSPSRAYAEWDAAQQLGAVKAEKNLQAVLEGGSKTPNSYLDERHTKLSPEKVRAFEARMQSMQDFAREQFKDNLNPDGTVTVYRGIHPPQSTKLKKAWEAAREEDLPHRINAGNEAVKTKARAMGLNPDDPMVVNRNTGNMDLDHMLHKAYESGFYAHQGKSDQPVALGQRSLSSWSTDSYDAGDFAGPNGLVVKVNIPIKDIWMMTGLGNRGVLRFMEDAQEIVTINRDATREVAIHGRGQKVKKRSGSGSFF